MPRWEVHLSFGIMALIVLLAGLLLGIWTPGMSIPAMDVITILILVLLLGGGAMIAGSVLPDIDGKGRIRWIIGPVAGSMVIAPPLIGMIRAGGVQAGLDFITGPGSLLFLGTTIAAYLLLVAPKKHRGAWHRTRTGMAFGMIWGSYVWATAAMTIDQSVLIGAMGTLGYGWHLALDGRLI
jgi:hypothetical protein